MVFDLLNITILNFGELKLSSIHQNFLTFKADSSTVTAFHQSRLITLGNLGFVSAILMQRYVVLNLAHLNLIFES